MMALPNADAGLCRPCAHSPLILEAHRWMTAPTVWGQMDCMLSVADWFQRVHGFDPAAHLRFTYDSPASCHRQTGWLRDPLSVVADVAEARGGLSRAAGAPIKGDIGLLRLFEGGQQVHSGGVWMGRGWLIKGFPSGATVRAPAAISQAVAVWGMGYVDP